MTYQFTFRLFFFVLNFVDVDKKPSLPKKSAFHGYFVVYSRLRILNVHVVERILKRPSVLSQQ